MSISGRESLKSEFLVLNNIDAKLLKSFSILSPTFSMMECTRLECEGRLTMMEVKWVKKQLNEYSIPLTSYTFLGNSSLRNDSIGSFLDKLSSSSNSEYLGKIVLKVSTETCEAISINLNYKRLINTHQIFNKVLLIYKCPEVLILRP